MTPLPPVCFHVEETARGPASRCPWTRAQQSRGMGVGSLPHSLLLSSCLWPARSAGRQGWPPKRKFAVLDASWPEAAATGEVVAQRLSRGESICSLGLAARSWAETRGCARGVWEVRRAPPCPAGAQPRPSPGSQSLRPASVLGEGVLMLAQFSGLSMMA